MMKVIKIISFWLILIVGIGIWLISGEEESSTHPDSQSSQSAPSSNFHIGETQ